MEESLINQFYKSTNVFITGGTGFMGKILIEKLLRSTDVHTLYILVREKWGKNLHTRIHEFFDDVVFDRLKKECPKFEHRVQFLNGDCKIAGLALNMTDRQTLITHVNIIFHVAATVKMDENLKDAYAINVHGAKEIVDLAKHMKHLKSMIHVSTAFSHCNRETIDEKFYGFPYSYRGVSDLLEKMSKEEAAMLTQKILGDFPNTYTFTKCLAESMIKEIGHGIPLGIFRPGIVTSTYKEPIESWTDNMYGPTGIVAGSFSGVLRVMPCRGEASADIVPVDTCIAGLIASAWEVGTRDCERTTENIMIYNYVSSTENLLTWDDICMMSFATFAIYPPINLIFPHFLFMTSIISYKILKIFIHIIPAVLMDVILVLIGNKTRMLKVYQKIHRLQGTLSYFSTRSWKFPNRNMVNLWTKLNSTDKELYPFSMTTVHWTKYFKKYVLGIRLYLLKDPESTVDEAVKRLKRLNIIYGIMKYVLIYILGHLTLCVASNMLNLIY